MTSCRENFIMSTPEEFSATAGIPLHFLYQWCQDESKEQNHYRLTSIGKADGSLRVLSVPSPMLKKAQKTILRMLEPEAAISPAAHAYQKGCTLARHSQCHAGAPRMVKTDISDFFGAITFSQVFWAIDRALKASPLFGSDHREGPVYNGRLSWFLASICTLNGHLPQGAPTSPLLSNMVMKSLDSRILGYCEKRAITYTRYADDMIFSGKSFSSKGLLSFLELLLTENGFTLNAKKTAVLGPGKQHMVTGAVANSRPQAPASYRKEIRQEMYYIGKHGLRSHMERKELLVPFSQEYRKECGGAAPPDAPDLIRYTQRLLGRIQFVLQINPCDLEFQQYKRECLLLLRQLPWLVLQ